MTIVIQLLLVSWVAVALLSRYNCFASTKTGKIRRRAGSLSLSENELESDNEFVQ